MIICHSLKFKEATGSTTGGPTCILQQLWLRYHEGSLSCCAAGQSASMHIGLGGQQTSVLVAVKLTTQTTLFNHAVGQSASL